MTLSIKNILINTAEILPGAIIAASLEKYFILKHFHTELKSVKTISQISAILVFLNLGLEGLKVRLNKDGSEKVTPISIVKNATTRAVSNAVSIAFLHIFHPCFPKIFRNSQYTQMQISHKIQILFNNIAKINNVNSTTSTGLQILGITTGEIIAHQLIEEKNAWRLSSGLALLKILLIVFQKAYIDQNKVKKIDTLTSISLPPPFASVPIKQPTWVWSMIQKMIELFIQAVNYIKLRLPPLTARHTIV